MADPRFPATCFVTCAGYGKRLFPLTRDRPKPLVPFAGRPLLDRILDQLKSEGIERVIMNAHYQAGQIEAFARRRDDLHIDVLVEDVLLDTGGGACRALSYLTNGQAPFFACHGDVLWQGEVLPALWQDWVPDKSDMVLALKRCSGGAAGDFLMDKDGFLRRPVQGEAAPYWFFGPRIVHPRVFEEVPEGPFSFNLLFDRGIESGRLTGKVMDNPVWHISTPADWGAAEAEFSSQTC